MLNTSLHNHNVRDKPTAERFVTMNRGINEGRDLPEELLRVSGGPAPSGARPAPSGSPPPRSLHLHLLLGCELGSASVWIFTPLASPSLRRPGSLHHRAWAAWEGPGPPR